MQYTSLRAALVLRTPGSPSVGPNKHNLLITARLSDAAAAAAAAAAAVAAVAAVAMH